MDKKNNEFSEEIFNKLTKIVYDNTKIDIDKSKYDMLHGRLVRRLREINLDSFDNYCQLVASSKDEFDEFISLVTTNLSSFFRECHHFEYLKNNIIPEVKEKNKDKNKLRIWSAACSTGQEPYSIAMTLHEFYPELIEEWDIKIIASDISKNVIHRAKQAVYKNSEMTQVGLFDYKKYLQRGVDKNLGYFRVKKNLKDKIDFKIINLFNNLEMDKFDIIFCRNVLIYFKKEDQIDLIRRITQKINHNGYLMLGYSEKIFNTDLKYKHVGRTIYKYTGNLE